MDISKVRSINEGISTANNTKTIASKEPNLSFKDIINNEIDKVNNKQIQADELIQDFIRGDAKSLEDLHTVMIATEEARIALELAVQVRNKIVEAYKEINNMQL
jgi:flagellar hook-basal body complex protein FliE